MAAEVQLHGLVGQIRTVPRGFAIMRPGQLDPVGRVDWPAAGAAEYHRGICLYLAYLWFGAWSRPTERLRLAEYIEPSPLEGYERWSWMPRRHGLVRATHYQVWVRTPKLGEPPMRPARGTELGMGPLVRPATSPGR